MVADCRVCMGVWGYGSEPKGGVDGVGGSFYLTGVSLIVNGFLNKTLRGCPKLQCEIS